MTISESPNTFRYWIFRAIALKSPWINASYSTILFVHSNSSLHDSIVFSPSGLTKIRLAPTPSLDFDPSKYKDQNTGLSTGLFTISSAIVTHLGVSVWEKISIYDVKLLTEKGDDWALKLPKNDSAE